MKQVLTILLEKDETIEAIRRRYVPDYEKYQPHITLVYPFECEDQATLGEHISESLRDFEPFEISLEGLQRSAKGYYLYLLVDRGKETIIHLHDTLNAGVLDKSRNPDMPEYIPHLTIGIFASQEERERAIDELSTQNVRFRTTIDSIQLLTIDEDDSLKSREDFHL